MKPKIFFTIKQNNYIKLERLSVALSRTKTDLVVEAIEDFFSDELDIGDYKYDESTFSKRFSLYIDADLVEKVDQFIVDKKINRTYFINIALKPLFIKYKEKLE